VAALVGNADVYTLFNLLTGPRLLERVQASLPAHRARLFPPTETLSMFLAQVLSAEGGVAGSSTRPQSNAPWAGCRGAAATPVPTVEPGRACQSR
jgi:hypothetical protein